ncbi:hypothetical protein KCP76_13340 [Salmonella enterica subsp. enterica serovar Weltevreden]|nr:hypothetical protein KCP76_13340 [Salmonella enterica subsp. enterica serovar Weltevreden]
MSIRNVPNQRTAFIPPDRAPGDKVYEVSNLRKPTATARTDRRPELRCRKAPSSGSRTNGAGVNRPVPHDVRSEQPG